MDASSRTIVAFRIGDVPVEVGPGTLGAVAALSLAFAGIAWLRFPAAGVGRLLIIGSVIAAVFYVSVLAHELAHALAARAYGLRVRRLRLTGTGGFCERLDPVQSARQEAVIAAAGPTANLAFAVVALVAGLFIRPATPAALALTLIWASLGLLVGTSLLPVYASDGGRVLHAALWAASGNADRATRRVRLFSRLLSVGIALAGLALCIVGRDFVIGAILLFLGLYFLRLGRL